MSKLTEMFDMVTIDGQKLKVAAAGALALMAAGCASGAPSAPITDRRDLTVDHYGQNPRRETGGNYRDYGRPIDNPVMRWGTINYVGQGPMEGCWLVQRWAVVAPDGVERVENRVVAHMRGEPEFTCKLSGLITGGMSDLQYNGIAATNRLR